MYAARMIFVSMLFVIGAEAIESQSPKIHFFNEKEKKLILDFHNEIRENVAKGGPKTPPGRIPPLEWDEGLADFARYSLSKDIGISRSCPRISSFDTCWYHGLQVDSVGRNVARSTASRLDRLLSSFSRPREHYRYGRFSGRDSSGMGLFTQVIWADTKKIGCALLQNCESGHSIRFAMLVCNYAPNGNMVGEFPYYVNESDAEEHEDERDLVLNSCQSKEFDENNFSRRKNSLKHPVYKPYHNLTKADSNGPDLHQEETAKDALFEKVCNIIKNQRLTKLKKANLDNLLQACEKYKMGQNPITEQLSAFKIAIKVCEQVQEAKSEQSENYKSMDSYCRQFQLYDDEPSDKDSKN